MDADWYGNKFAHYRHTSHYDSDRSQAEDQTDQNNQTNQTTKVPRTMPQRSRRKPQQRYFRAPAFPGAAAFDLFSGQELPSSRSKKRKKANETQFDKGDEAGEANENAETWSSYVYHSRVMADIDHISNNFSSQSTQDNSAPQDLVPGTCNRDSVRANISGSSSDQDPVITVSSETVLGTGGDAMRDIPCVSAQALVEEAKKIYTDLASHDIEYENLSLKGSKSKSFAQEQWPLLLGAYSSLLSEHHDFFATTQHQSAPTSLKLLAKKYSMPGRIWKCHMKPSLELFRDSSSSAGTSLTTFVNITYSCLNSLSEHVPELSHEWDMIKYNLREYFRALQAEGVNIPTSYVDCWAKEYSPSTLGMRSTKPPMTGQFFGDDKDVERILYPQLLRDLTFSGGPGSTYSWGNNNTPLPVNDMLFLSFMGGWLHFGRKIATSFRAFCRTFFFLGNLAVIDVASISGGVLKSFSSSGMW